MIQYQKVQNERIQFLKNPAFKSSVILIDKNWDTRSNYPQILFLICQVLVLVS